MQDNKFTEFDSQIRMMMEDASEVAPVSSWSAINKKLKQKRAAVVWRRVGIGAALAALGLAVVLPLSIVKDSAGPEQLRAKLEEEPVGIIPSAEKTVSQFIAEASTPQAEGKVPQVYELRGFEEEQVEAQAPLMEEVQAPQEEEVQIPQKEEVKEQTSIGAKEEKVVVEERETMVAKADPFLQMEREDALAEMRKSNRTSLDIKGMLSSNDDIKKPVFLGKYGSPASFKTSSGKARVYENSDVSYDIPVSVGLGVKFALSEKVSLGTGISYTRLGRSFGGFFDSVPADKIVHSVQYVGIPVNIYYDVIKLDAFEFYCFAGGEAEKNIINRYRVGSGKEAQTYNDKTKGLQWSVAGGIGLEYHLAEKLGIYFDPSARYFFDCDQPISSRTKKPFQFSFEAGFRFDL